MAGLPFVRVKLAMSLDGRTAMESGESQWNTGPAARSAVQRLRARPRGADRRDTCWRMAHV